jgi:hypothetical protein
LCVGHGKLTEANICDLLRLAYFYSADQLKAAGLLFVEANFAAVSHSPDWLTMEQEAGQKLNINSLKQFLSKSKTRSD